MAEQVQRLSKLNKTLLLLSKIENNQFPESKPIDLSLIVKNICDDLIELIEFKSLNLEIEILGDPVIVMNNDLAKMLFANLIRNAINHNLEAGFIKIKIQVHSFSITNTGKELLVSPELLFERFAKKSDNPQSTGLGLSIIKTICDLYGFGASYACQEKIHTVSISF